MSPQTSIRQGSKSFYFASLFFNAETKQRCWKLYQWCRYCDDQIDKAQTPSEAQMELALLRDWTEKAVKTNEPVPPVFAHLREVAHEARLSYEHLVDLLEGFAMDVTETHFRTLADVEKYAYHVAGVVGLMMSQIMGVTDPQAKPYAVAMGNAMQLTNIARDVHEDLKRGRCYLPEAWLEEEGLSPSTMMEFKNQEALYRVVLRLLDRAEELYKEGRRGLRFIPTRARWAVSIASLIYRHIGIKIQREGPMALNERIYVTKSEKLSLAFQGVITT